MYPRHGCDFVTMDPLGNEIIAYSANCIHFERFVGFSPQMIAHQRWLEAVAEEQARREAELSDAKAASTCYVCGGKGHWARDCPSKQANTDAKQPEMADDPMTVVETPKLQQAAPKPRKSYKPRVLSKPPPRGQTSAKDAFKVNVSSK